MFGLIFFYKDFSPKLKALVNILGVVLFVFPFCGVVIYFSWQYVANSWQIWEISADEGVYLVIPSKQ